MEVGTTLTRTVGYELLKNHEGGDGCCDSDGEGGPEKGSRRVYRQIDPVVYGMLKHDDGVDVRPLALILIRQNTACYELFEEHGRGGDGIGA